MLRVQLLTACDSFLCLVAAHLFADGVAVIIRPVTTSTPVTHGSTKVIDRVQKPLLLSSHLRYLANVRCLHPRCVLTRVPGGETLFKWNGTSSQENIPRNAGELVTIHFKSPKNSREKGTKCMCGRPPRVRKACSKARSRCTHFRVDSVGAGC